MKRPVISSAIDRTAVWLSLVFLVSRGVIFYLVTGQSRTDLNLYRGYVERIAAGNIPFKDFFPEYPPLAFQFISLPAIIDPSLALTTSLRRFTSRWPSN